jgi:hypothetical protein
LIALIEPHYPKGDGGRPAYPLLAMLRVHLMQNWFGYSDPAMEEALYETTMLRQFAGLNLDRIPDESTILNYRRLLEKHELVGGILHRKCIKPRKEILFWHQRQEETKRQPKNRQIRTKLPEKGESRHEHTTESDKQDHDSKRMPSV